KVLTRVLPIYPPIARSMNLSGSVKLEIVVAPTGSVKSIQVIGGSPVFSQAAEGAVRAWKWEKAEHETTERLEVEFKPWARWTCGTPTIAAGLRVEDMFTVAPRT